MGKKILIYLSDGIPDDLAKLTNDGFITISKDGIRTFQNGIYIRICVRIKQVSGSEDKERLSKVINTLQYLKNNDKIIDFVVQE